MTGAGARYAIVCVKPALECEIDSMREQVSRCRPRAGVLSVLRSILASKGVVLDIQHGWIDWEPV